MLHWISRYRVREVSFFHVLGLQFSRIKASAGIRLPITRVSYAITVLAELFKCLNIYTYLYTIYIYIDMMGAEYFKYSIVRIKETVEKKYFDTHE